MSTITGTDIEGMVQHWLHTPAGSYLGSDYGSNLKDLLQRPQSEVAANAVIDKLRRDVPLLGALPAGEVNLYSVAGGADKAYFVIEVAGRAIQLPGG